MDEYHYDDSGMNQRKKKDDETRSWVIIGILFVLGLWPIALILLIVKLTDRRKQPSARKNPGTGGSAQRSGAAAAARRSVEQMTRTPAASTKSARTMRTVGIVLVVLGAVISLQVLSEMGFYLHFSDFWRLVEDIFPGIGFLAGGAALMAGSRSMTNRMRRFSKYLAVAGKEPSVEIARLARAAEVKLRRTEEDLEQMIDQGLWGEEAYLDLGEGKLYRSAQAAAAEEAEKERKAARNAAESVPHEAEEGYSGMLRQIRRANDRIADEEVSQKIDRLEDLSARIFRLVEQEPAKKATAGTFLNYYLPTTLKLLNSYAEFEEAGISGQNLNEAKARIERIMDNLVAGFERQLDELYRTDTMDIESDIRVMEAMLRRDSASAEEDFGLESSQKEN